MNVIMARPKSPAATRARRVFLGMHYGAVLDLEFDNDNEKPITADHLRRTIRAK